MTKHSLIMENWRRFLKEEEEKEQTFQEALENVPLEEGGGLVAAFMALVGMSGEMPQDMQGVEINDQNYTIEQIAQAHNKLEKLSDKHASGVKAGQEALVDAVHDAIVLERDSDGDGFYELTNDNWSSSNNEGLVYGSMVLKHVTKSAQPDAKQDTGSPDTGEFKDVRSGKATNVDVMAAMLINSGQSKIMTPEKRLAKAKKLLEIGNSDQGNMSPETKQALEKFIANGGK